MEDKRTPKKPVASPGRLKAEASLAPAAQVLNQSDADLDSETLDKMAGQRLSIMQQIDARLNHPMMRDVPPLQKQLMRIELMLGAGFALAALELPLGAVFLREASAMSEGIHQQAEALGAQTAGSSG